MFNNLLDKEVCTSCGMCCCYFYKNQQGPYISSEQKSKIINTYNPYAEFTPYMNGYLITTDKKPYKALDKCPFLKANNCMLGADKPLSCKIWPYEVMKLKGSLVITISPQCPEAYSLPLSDIINNVRTVSDFIFAAAEAMPEIITPYRRGYPVIAVYPD